VSGAFPNPPGVLGNAARVPLFVVVVVEV
jgi:hypothetical protein